MMVLQKARGWQRGIVEKGSSALWMSPKTLGTAMSGVDLQVSRPLRRRGSR